MSLMIGASDNRLLDRLLIAGEVLVLGWLIATEDVSRIGLLLLGVAGVISVLAIVFSKFPIGALSLLVTSAALPRFAGTILNLHVRAEHVAIGLVVLMTAFEVRKGNVSRWFELKTFDYCLIAYVVLNFFTSAVTSPEPQMTIRWAALNALAVLPYFLMRILVKNENTLYKTFLILLGVGAAESAYGIIVFLSHYAFDTKLGVEPEQYGSTSAVYGTQYEPNLFGSYAACCAIMFLALFVMTPARERRWWYSGGLALTTLGATISLARSVFVALPIVAVIVLRIAWSRGIFRLKALVPLMAVTGLLLLAVSPLVVDAVRERFSTVEFSDIASDDTTWERLIQMGIALEDVQAHPLLGTGTASFHLSFDPADYPEGFAGDAEEPGWISNTPLRILHDTGIVGLAAFLVFVGSLVAAVRAAAKKATGSSLTVLTAIFCGSVLYAITFQATEATMLAFTWVHIGLLAAAATILREKADSTETLVAL
jgi:O-antigen ligase